VLCTTFLFAGEAGVASQISGKGPWKPKSFHAQCDGERAYQQSGEIFGNCFIFIRWWCWLWWWQREGGLPGLQSLVSSNYIVQWREWTRVSSCAVGWRMLAAGTHTAPGIPNWTVGR